MWDVTTDTCINFHGCLDWPLRKLGPAREIICLVQLFRLIRLMGTSIYLCGLAFKFNPSLIKYYHCSLNSNFIFPKTKFYWSTWECKVTLLYFVLIFNVTCIRGIMIKWAFYPGFSRLCLKTISSILLYDGENTVLLEYGCYIHYVRIILTNKMIYIPTKS